jgi:hypothetical protein
MIRTNVVIGVGQQGTAVARCCAAAHLAGTATERRRLADEPAFR